MIIMDIYDYYGYLLLLWIFMIIMDIYGYYGYLWKHFCML